MKPLKVESTYTVSAYEPEAQAWFYYGSRKNLAEARLRREELRKRFKRVRIIKHELSTNVVL